MVIRVNISELESKAKYAESLSIQLKIKEDEINSIYYSLDPKVKSRNGIGQSIISLQKRIEEAQKKMYNISKFLYSAAENYRNAEEQIVSNSKRFEDRHRLYDEQYSDYNYIKNLNIFEGTDIEGINSVNNVEMDSRVIDYLKKSGNQLILGNYTEDVTLLGTLMQVGTGLLGVDLPMDLRDILYDFTNWKWSWEHAGKAGMDLLALFPIIGGLKYADEASSLAKAAFKNTDEASTLMKGALKNTDEASTLIKGSLKSSDEISDIAKGVDETFEVATKGAADPITKSEYSSLRKKTPSNDIRKMVNPEGPKIDPVYGYATDVLEADHIVPMKEIVDMPGFTQLSREQQIEVLNLQDNFIGLGKSTNASKGAKNWTDWQGHSKLGEVPSDVRGNMLELESSARTALQKAIEERLRNDKY